MKPYPLLFKPVFKERIWGGPRIKEIFNCPGYGKYGEARVISNHPSGKSLIVNGKFSGQSLSSLLKKCPEWFSNTNIKNFPLLVKILDSNDNLSIQVHPDDEYAIKNENGESGKTECWYIIEAEPGAELVIGHRAKNKREFIRLSKTNKWDELLSRVPVRAGDFFFIPSGTVHALGKGVLLLEIQQNSDITYRLYDYDRTGLNGEKRTLHFEKAIDVITYQSIAYKPKPFSFEDCGVTKTFFISCNYFTVEKWLIKKRINLNSLKAFLLIFIVDGYGELVYSSGSLPLKRGVSIMIPAKLDKCKIIGDVEAIVSYM